MHFNPQNDPLIDTTEDAADLTPPRRVFWISPAPDSDPHDEVARAEVLWRPVEAERPDWELWLPEDVLEEPLSISPEQAFLHVSPGDAQQGLRIQQLRMLLDQHRSEPIQELYAFGVWPAVLWPMVPFGGPAMRLHLHVRPGDCLQFERYKWLKPLWQQVLRSADTLWCSSEGQRAYLRKLCGRTASLVPLGSGVDPSDWVAREPVQTQERIVLAEAPGGEDSGPGLATLQRATEALREALSLRLWIAERERPSQDMAEALEKASVYVYLPDPARPWDDVPASMLAALESGTPTIVLSEETPDIITEGQSGWVVHPEDHSGLVRALRAALSGSDYARSLAEGGQAVVRWALEPAARQRRWREAMHCVGGPGGQLLNTLLPLPGVQVLN